MFPVFEPVKLCKNCWKCYIQLAVYITYYMFNQISTTFIINQKKKENFENKYSGLVRT